MTLRFGLTLLLITLSSLFTLSANAKPEDTLKVAVALSVDTICFFLPEYNIIPPFPPFPDPFPNPFSDPFPDPFPNPFPDPFSFPFFPFQGSPPAF